MHLERNLQLLFNLIILTACLINFQVGMANMKKSSEVLDILQFGNEEPIEPFDVTTVIIRTDFKTNTDTAFFQLDTLNFLTDPKHTRKIWTLLQEHTPVWTCGMSYCYKDSITSLDFERIE